MSDPTELSDVLQALAEPNRLRLLRLLSRREVCVTAAARMLGLSQPLVSQHLRVLRQAGLIEGERRGRRVHYRVRQSRWEWLVRELAEMLGTEEEPPRTSTPRPKRRRDEDVR